MPVHIPSSEAVKALLSRLERSTAPTDAELLSMLNSPSVACGLDHWSLWCLICLARHLERQKWVGYIVETRLRGELDKIGTAGALGHPESMAQKGEVPDEPDWDYFFHGCGCCLTHRPDGLTIDVDFDRDGATEAIDPFFYTNFLSSIPKPELPERLLKHSSPFENAWHAEIPVLEQLRCVTREHRMRLTPLGGEIAELLRPVAERLTSLSESATDDSRRRLVLGALALGDPVLASQAAEASTNTSFALPLPIAEQREHAESQRALRLRTIVERSSEQKIPEFIALAAMGAKFSREVVSEALFRSPVDGMANTALEVLSAWEDAEFPQLLRRLLMQRKSETGFAYRLARLVQPKAEDTLPRGYQIAHASIALLKRIPPAHLEPTSKQTILELARGVSGANAGEAAMVMYLLDREAGLRAIAAAVSNRVPAAYQDAVIACVLIGSSETKDLLKEALNSPNEQIQHNAACGLAHFKDADAAKLVHDWKRRNDGIDQPLGREILIGDRTVETYSFDDVSHANMNVFFEAALERMEKKFGPMLRRQSTE